MSVSTLFRPKINDLETMRDISDDVNEGDYVPYACHFSPHTLLTKNGEILQTLKVVGFTFENLTAQKIDLRTALRAAMREAITGTEYAVWLHTIRRRVSLSPTGEYPQDFSRLLNAAWRTANEWDKQFVNEVYITVIKEGESAKITQPSDFFRGLVTPLDVKHRWGFLEHAEEQLSEVVDSIAQRLAVFGVRRLSLSEQGGVIYSEPLSFLNKLIHLLDEPMPLPEIGLSDYLTSSEITFGFNAMEVRSSTGRRRFGTILTLKEYREMPAASIDLLLQLPLEFVVSQSLDFIPAKKALAAYQDQKEVLEWSQQDELARDIGLSQMLEDKHRSAVDFCEQQITFFVLGDSVKHLEDCTQRMLAGLNGLGILSVREDIKFEEAYWAQLPANFEFLRRQKPLDTARAGGFAQISSIPTGLSKGSIWGSPITLFSTAINTPYFFNYHIDRNGHTSIVGPMGAGKTVLLNFLLSESRKVNNRLFFFDYNRSAEIFLRSIGAGYYTLQPHPKVTDELSTERLATLRIPKLNPLQLEDTPQNRSFLLIWLDAIVRTDRFYRPEMSDEFGPHFQAAIEHVYTLPRSERRLATIVEFLRESAPKIITKLHSWYGEGENAHWFGELEDTLDLSSGLVGFDVGPVMADTKIASPIIAYLLHRVMLTLDGQPTIIVLDEAWDLLDNPLFATRLGGWLEMLRSRNTLAILATEKPDDALQSRLSPMIMQQVATQIYLPNPSVMSEEYGEIFGLTTQECQLVARMRSQERHFLLKRGHEAVVLEAKLAKLPKLLTVLSSSEKTLQAMDKAIATHGATPVDWLHHFLEKVA
jgi:type IV secretion system protein VirB4